MRGRLVPPTPISEFVLFLTINDVLGGGNNAHAILSPLGDKKIKKKYLSSNKNLKHKK